MTNLERIEKFCIEYFNKHDLDTEDEPITSSDISIMSYTDVGTGWRAFVYMPRGCGYIYEMSTVDVYGTVSFTKYSRCGGSLYKWNE